MTTSNPQTPEKRRRPWLTVITLITAVIALVFGGLAAVQSWRAADNAARVLERIDALTPVPPATPEVEGSESAEIPVAPPVTESAGVETTESTPVLNAQTQYTKRYEGEDLKVPVACNTAIHVDLDEPRVKVASSRAEFFFEDPCGTNSAYINLSAGVNGSAISSATVTPFECAESIRRSPMSSDQYPIRRGQVYCITTSRDAARDSADTWKMVLLEVSAVGQDGTVTFRSSAWDIPV